MPYDKAEMKSTISAFLENIKLGNLSSRTILDGIIRFEEAIERELEDLRPSNEGKDLLQQHGVEGVKGDTLQSALSSFVVLVLRTVKKELPPPVFLGTEFDYEIAPDEAPERQELAIIKGLESLMHLHARTPTAKPLQTWADIATATNFVQAQAASSLEFWVGEPHEDSAVTPSPESGRKEDASPALDQPLSKHDDPQNITDEQTYHKDCSIGMMIEQCYGVREDCLEDKAHPGYKRAFRNWQMFLTSFILDKQRHQDFRARLSTSQINSARLLIEWWIDDIGLEQRTPLAFQALEEASRTGHLDEDAFQLFGVTPLANAGEKRDYYLQRLLFDCSGPPYHTFMFRLLQLEFLPCHYSRVMAIKTLSNARQKAAKLAAAQSVALGCYKTLLGGTATSSGTEVRKVSREDNILSSKMSEHDARKILSGGTLHIKKESLSPEESERLQKAVYLDSGQRVGASLSPCEWLEGIDVSEDLPHYLWSVQERRTVLARKLPETIEYTAISHTWGRYKHRDYGQFPPVCLEGTQEWAIPQNSKFQVDMLPDILTSVPFNTPYVWFDLVCIPQEPTKERLIAIAKQEVGRQAKIFRRAKYAVAWLNDIDTWKGMNAAIRRLSIHFLQEGNEDGIPQSVVDLAALDNDSELELFGDTSESNEAPEDFMNRWFSSLWTLQEVCLRPDMRLCNKNWEVLAVGDNADVHIGMDDLIALADGGHVQANAWEVVASAEPRISENANVSEARRINPQSKATEQLWEVLDLSGLEHLLNASRSTILTLGNQRYCRKNRAEAIMSAVGVTDWFATFQRESSDREAPQDTSQYPHDFLTEAASKLGAEFYASSLAEGELLEMLVLSLQPVGQRREGVGSMVPFTSSLLSRAPSTSEGFTAPDHPAVSTWTVLPDRSIEIRKAGILSYTGQPRSGNRGLTCACVAPDTEEPVSLQVKASPKVDLDVWIDSFLPSTRNFAVCLHHGLGVSDGVLLKEVSSGELIKVGTFHVARIDVYKEIKLEVFDVNWRVL